MNDIIQSDQVENLVIDIRGERVLLDSDVAMLYGVETINFQMDTHLSWNKAKKWNWSKISTGSIS